MKKFYLVSAILLAFVSSSYGECTLHVTSTQGYIVNITISAPSVSVSTTTNCGNNQGYTFNVNLNYTVTFTGTNAANAQLYTLQAYLSCNSTNNVNNTPTYFALPLTGGSGTIASSTNAALKSDCATATPTSLGCTDINIVVQGTGISAQTISCPTNSVLPVTFFGFTATQAAGEANLQWFTATETNNSFFTVEKSSDGVNFSSLEKIAGKGTVNVISVYNTTDNTPFIGTTYYRIKQTDMDGSVTYSTITTVTTALSDSKINVFPNPNATQQVSFTGNTTNQRLDIFSMSGAKVFSNVLQGATLTLPKLAKGVYIFNFTNQTDGSHTKTKYIQQ